jgi:phosphatidylserine/phosphatidylglycerophosphate/cardiolipin synthase-like enzyme
MHHKFLIFLDKQLNAYGIWTGSYNLTNNANKSLDNGLFITDKKIINGYIEEFEQILFLSEKLNWESSQPKLN